MELYIENNVLLGFEKYTMWKEDEYTHIVVPDTVTEIAQRAFDGCERIVGVTTTATALIRLSVSRILRAFLCKNLSPSEKTGHPFFGMPCSNG